MTRFEKGYLIFLLGLLLTALGAVLFTMSLWSPGPRCVERVQTGTRTQPLYVGKMVIMQTYPTYECIRYEEIPK